MASSECRSFCFGNVSTLSGLGHGFGDPVPFSAIGFQDQFFPQISWASENTMLDAPPP